MDGGPNCKNEAAFSNLSGVAWTGSSSTVSRLNRNLELFFFAVPSENKRDVRSIEETLNDIRKRKKFRPDDDDENEVD